MTQEQIIDEAYENYRKTILTEFFENTKELRKWAAVEGPGGYNKEEFINKCKTNPEFSEKWGLKIEERELSLEERMVLCKEKWDYSWNRTINLEDIEWRMNNEWNVPTKQITLEYNNEKIESYE